MISSAAVANGAGDAEKQGQRRQRLNGAAVTPIQGELAMWHPFDDRPESRDAAQTQTVFPLQTPAGPTAPLQIETTDSFQRMLIEHKSRVHSETGNSRYHTAVLA